jgi:uncharacterized protein (TIGR02453 family)
MSVTFGPETWAFLDGLAADNTKATFDANRSTYQAHVTEPSAALVGVLADLLPAQVHPGLRAEAKVGRSLFRINRDIRFSKDKTPYKTHLDFLFWIGDGPPRSQPVCILRLTSSEVVLGAGQAGLRGPDLQRYRDRLDDDAEGARIAAIVASLRSKGSELSEPDRAKPPRPHPVDHPNAELLRRDGFHLSSAHPHPAGVDSTRFPAWCTTRLAPYRPLLEWLDGGP